MDTITKKKRADLEHFVQQVVVQDDAIQGIVVIGSVAKGVARADSDIDAVVFLEPFDLYTVPAESKWGAESGTFYGISTHAPSALQLDFKRVDLAEWSKLQFSWPETMGAELSEGWIAFDRHNNIEPLINERTRFTDDVRQMKLDDAIVKLDWLIKTSSAEQTWNTLGPTVAHYRLHSAYDYLVQGLFAYNRQWRTLRSRELSDLLSLAWLPDRFEEQLLLATNALSADFDGYTQRQNVLHRFFSDLVTQCQQDQLYGTEAVNEAFIRQHNEPGRDWNMEEWNRLHQQRNKKIKG